jgi:hypothetical protein
MGIKGKRDTNGAWLKPGDIPRLEKWPYKREPNGDYTFYEPIRADSPYYVLTPSGFGIVKPVPIAVSYSDMEKALDEMNKEIS